MVNVIAAMNLLAPRSLTIQRAQWPARATLNRCVEEAGHSVYTAKMAMLVSRVARFDVLTNTSIFTSTVASSTKRYASLES